MARPTSISDETILAAAREVFLEKGFSATTAEIARSAGVSEGSIFRRWPTKDLLFAAAMGLPKPQFIGRLQQTELPESVEEELTLLALEMIAFFKEVIPKMVMLHVRKCGHMHMDEDSPPVMTFKRVSAFLSRAHDAGMIDVVDSDVVARMFIGSLHFYAFQSTIWSFPEQVEPDVFVDGLVQSLFAGIAP